MALLGGKHHQGATESEGPSYKHGKHDAPPGVDFLAPTIIAAGLLGDLLLPFFSKSPTKHPNSKDDMCGKPQPLLDCLVLEWQSTTAAPQQNSVLLLANIAIANFL